LGEIPHIHHLDQTGHFSKIGFNLSTPSPSVAVLRGSSARTPSMLDE
jgi:hypothetical protein